MTRDPSRTHAVRSAAALLFALSALSAVSASCAGKPRDPIQLDGNMLTVDNRTADDWSNVEIWVNTYFRILAPSIPARSRFQSPLDVAVTGFGQRFDFKRMQLKDVRLVATRPDGQTLEIKKEFQASGLAGALGGKR